MSEPKHLTGPEHFAAAEWCLAKAEALSDPAEMQAWAVVAQAHAALALAAATAPATVKPADPATDGPRHPALSMPAPKGYKCPACGHSINVHREHGCDVDGCDCPAPHGRIMPGDPA